MCRNKSINITIDFYILFLLNKIIYVKYLLKVILLCIASSIFLSVLGKIVSTYIIIREQYTVKEYIVFGCFSVVVVILYIVIYILITRYVLYDEYEDCAVVKKIEFFNEDRIKISMGDYFLICDKKNNHYDWKNLSNAFRQISAGDKINIKCLLINEKKVIILILSKGKMYNNISA